MRAGFSVPVIAPDGSAPSLPASRASPISAEEKSSSIWQTHALPLHQHRLMQAIVNCRTAALGLGGAVEWCDHCQNTRIVYRSCRDRHCPKCQALARERWIQQRLAELLPVEYFHVVFTVPEQIAAIAFYNKVVVYQILFRTVAATLLTIARDPQHLDAEIGFFAVLHTWGQNLHLHPHLHCVVPGGGLSPDGEWKACLPGFFLPVRVRSRLFRRLFLEALEKAYADGQLQFFSDLEPLRDPLCLRSISGACPPNRMGGLRQATLRRTAPGDRVSRPLHPSRGHLQPASGSAARRPSFVSLERLPAPGTAQGNDGLRRGVHPPFPAACAAARLSAHPLLRLARQLPPGR